MSRRVLYVEMAHGFGGSIVSLYQLLRALDRSRYEPVVLFYRPNVYLPHFQELGAKVLVLSSLGGREKPPNESAHLTRPQKKGMIYRWGAQTYALMCQVLPGTSRLWQVIRREAIDLVHLNDVIISNREGILAARLAGVPCVSHVRAFETLTPFDRWLARRVDAFVYISQAIQKAHELQGVPPERGRVIYNALNAQEFLSASDRMTARRQLGLDERDQAVGIVGRLVAWKGHRLFLEAMGPLASSYPRLRCVIIGGEECTEPAYRLELEALASALGLRERTIFTGYCANVSSLLPALDVLVHCSLKPEPFGRVIIEGMAAGVPVVGADDGAVPEIIDDGRNGLLVPPGNVPALARAVARLLDNPELAVKLADGGRRSVEERFSVQTHVRSVQEVYERLLGSGQ